MKLALAQVNPCTGDLEGNVERCLAAVAAARAMGAALIVLPEMVIPGAIPRDILFDPSFVEAVAAATRDLATRAGDGPPVVVGTLLAAETLPDSAPRRPHHPGLLNAAVLVSSSRVIPVAAKRLLPAWDVFFEPRWFLPGPMLPPVTVAGRQVGFLMEHDLEDEGQAIHPAAELLAAGAGLLVCLAASPYHRRAVRERLRHARRARCPLVYANLCGGNDELILDGHSFALDRDGAVIARLSGFEEEVRLVDLDHAAPLVEPADGEGEAEVYRALVLGVRDFARKNRLERAFVGLSGGVDSALVAIIAAEALGAEGVTGVAIPSRYTDPRSTACAGELARALGIGFEVVELKPLHVAAEQTLGGLLEGGTAAENVQARLRATILMGFVNRYGGLLLNTSNKTEAALGYGTLYGDMAGTLCPIADLTKPQVYALARWIQAARGVIPPYILERPPSAELRADQVDPFDYDVVAPAMERLVQANRSDAALRRSEHKRWQMGVVLKVSARSFGRGRLMPITRR
ncbi:MAG: NAD(+) synthase [Anaerolineae bacterium]|nr:NAD(+) synthase [Anaerolineae bacterium]